MHIISKIYKNLALKNKNKYHSVKKPSLSYGTEEGSALTKHMFFDRTSVAPAKKALGFFHVTPDLRKTKRKTKETSFFHPSHGKPVTDFDEGFISIRHGGLVSHGPHAFRTLLH